MKRVFDLLLCFVSLPLLLPILIILMILVRIKLGSPVFFTQQRPGKEGQPFRFVKFRSMTEQRDLEGNLLPDEQRLTVFGKKLRSTSLDELPSLFNVVRGDMSLVGPRPLLMRYLPLYNERQARRHEVKPGVTGWAQINGRNSISWEEKFELDLWYIENQSLLLDMKILCMTVLSTFLAKGISSEGHATMPEFSGTAEGEVRTD